MEKLNTVEKMGRPNTKVSDIGVEKVFSVYNFVFIFFYTTQDGLSKTTISTTVPKAKHISHPFMSHLVLHFWQLAMPTLPLLA